MAGLANEPLAADRCCTHRITQLHPPDHTRGDDVIVFGRARSMGLYTGRKAVQGGAIEFVERAGDFYVMYLNSDGSPGDYSQYPLDRPEARERGFTEVWRNHGWVIWRTPTSRAALP